MERRGILCVYISIYPPTGGLPRKMLAAIHTTDPPVDSVDN